MRLQQRDLIQHPAERRADAGDQQQVVGKPRQKVEELAEFVQRDVIEKRVAAIEQPRDAARRDVIDQLAVLREVDRSPGGLLPRQRWHGEHAAQGLNADR